ncbi:MAG TPA: hypothetical protein VFE05_01535 [Longimicrobiaceae bacterium]|nr:hypothetical protein [Longimicrobiaceae bacterium]
MTERDWQVQERMDAGLAPAPGGDDAEAAAYRLVAEALAEEPGFALPDGFAERMAAVVMPPPERLPLFERVLLPAVLVAAVIVVAPLAAAPLAEGLSPLAESPAIRWATVRPDLLAIAAAGLLAAFAADRLGLGRWAAHQPRAG